VTDARASGMQRRRDRILAEARRIIGEAGYEGLSTRALAAAAGVTPPTLYNLIGNKEAILRSLQMETVAAIEARLAPLDDGPAIDRIEAIVEQSVALFSEDEDFYRAGFLSGHELAGKDSMGALGEIDARSVRVAARACELARGQGLLRGRLSSTFVAEQMFRGYRVPFDDWARGFLDLPTARRQALQGIYCALAPDAVETFAAELLRRLKRLDTERTVAPPLLETRP
jgi:AcrR family transcriptional regulator